ncbi:hypothetical protein BKA64DRAFT_260042 [Cadophora sp. MPI-SDFR-AT-0126]|nr:hypothetical protein BKA64DRAFT_260042 [Leotiomycetes sp. MPI-SDFR-AT-0126]
MISSETMNLVFLQVAAKGHELLIIASLTTIIFQFSRHELLFGDGLPLGLVGSGILFGNMGYFFSREFLGSLSYAGNRWRKALFLLTLLIAGVTAALAGPSSAVLMVPTNQKVSGGGTSFYMKGTKDDLWPIQLDANLTETIPYCNSENSTRYAVCPSGGFQSLWSRFSQVDSSNFKTAIGARSYAKSLSGASVYWSIDSPLSLVPRVYTLGDIRNKNGSQASTFLVQPHAATAIMLQRITTDWWGALASQSKQKPDAIDDRVAEARVPSPLTRVKCSPPRNLSAILRDVEFPIVQENSWMGSANLALDTLSSNASDHLRFQWIHLPESFGVATIGSVFESPWTGDNSSRVVVGCTLKANWVNATIFTDEYSFWNGWYPWNIEFGTLHPSWITPKTGEPSYPTNGRIAVSDSWLDMLTPPTPPEGPPYYPWKPSTIESILMTSGLSSLPEPGSNVSPTEDWLEGDVYGGNKTAMLELIICSVFEDGLSRSGIQEMYNISGSASTWPLSTYEKMPDYDIRILDGRDAINPPNLFSGNLTRLRVRMSVSGYAYQGSLAEYLAMTVLFVHIFFAIAHISWTLFHAETSDSWDSISKIITLAQNSKPTFGPLKNTGAGIDHLRTFSRLARIRATRDTESTEEADRVQLLFEEDKKSRSSQSYTRIRDGDKLPLFDDDQSIANVPSSYPDIESHDEENVPVTLQEFPHQASGGVSEQLDLQIPATERFTRDGSLRGYQTWPVYSSRNTSFSSTVPLVLASSSRQDSLSSMQAIKSRPGSAMVSEEIEQVVEVGRRYG